MTNRKPSPRPLRADAVQNHGRLVAAAREVFRDRGLDAPLEDIARQAGVGIGTLYRRFPDRKALILAVFEEKLDQTIAAARSALTGTDAWTEFHTLLMFMFGIVAEDKGMREHLIGSRYPLSVAVSARAELVELLQRGMANAQRTGDLRDDVTARDIPPMMLMVGVVADFATATSPDLWKRYATIMIDGLKSRGAPSILAQSSLTADGMSRSMTHRPPVSDAASAGPEG